MSVSHSACPIIGQPTLTLLSFPLEREGTSCFPVPSFFSLSGDCDCSAAAHPFRNGGQTVGGSHSLSVRLGVSRRQSSSGYDRHTLIWGVISFRKQVSWLQVQRGTSMETANLPTKKEQMHQIGLAVLWTEHNNIHKRSARAIRN